MASSCPGKNSWPELVGVNGQKAAEKIEKENENVEAICEGTPVPQDSRCDRFWVWVDHCGNVTEVPTIG